MRKLSMTPWVSVALSLFMSLWAACTDDPQDPATWTKKLDDVREQREALRQLAKLKDPSSYDALAKLFKKTKEAEVLNVIASLRTEKAVDLFIDQLDYSDENYDNAKAAAKGLAELARKDDKGREAAKQAVEALKKAAVKPLPIKTRANLVKVEAMDALTAIRDPRAVDALDQVLETSADEQDFFLNKEAARHLGTFADPHSVPSLVRGLFMTGRGRDIFQECRLALVRIGDPAVDKVVETMQRKNPQVEADAKKYEFFPGIVVQKTSILLGDLRSKRAIPALTQELGKKDDGLGPGCTPANCVSGHQSVLQVLGFIGDPSPVKLLTAFVADAKRPSKLRAAAATALNALNATEALPAILSAAKVPFYNAKKQEIDEQKATLATVAVTEYSRLLPTDQTALLQQLAKAAPPGTDVEVAFKNAVERSQLVKECGKDAECYGKALADKSPAKQEKAAFMLGRLGPAGIPILTKNVPHKDSATRFAILFSLTRVAGAHNKEVLKALEDQIETDKSKPHLLPLVDEMRVTEAIISHR